MQRGSEVHAVRFRLVELASRFGRCGPIEALRRRWDARSAAGVRWAPGRGAASAMVLLALLAAVGAGCWVWAARPHAIATAASAPGSALLPPVSPGGSLLSPVSRPSAAGASMLVIDVVGKVRRPGVYRLLVGSRVDDAVAAAGGVLAGVDPVTVNLARKLADGEQLVIGRSAGPAAAAVAGSGTGSAAAPDGPVDLNSATPAQLDALPGVGPVLAQRIVDWRDQHGRFGSVDQLRSVSGIGDAKFRDLAPLVSAG